MSDNNHFANLPVELTSEDISTNIMDAIKKLGRKQSSDHEQLMAELGTLEGIKEKVDVLEENYQNLLPHISKVDHIETHLNLSKIVEK